jgi:hypothetical protein
MGRDERFGGEAGSFGAKTAAIWAEKAGFRHEKGSWVVREGVGRNFAEYVEDMFYRWERRGVRSIETYYAK